MYYILDEERKEKYSIYVKELRIEDSQEVYKSQRLHSPPQTFKK